MRETIYTFASCLAIVVGAVVMSGWIMQDTSLITWTSHLAPLQPNGAIALILLGALNLVFFAEKRMVLWAILALLCVQLGEYIIPTGISTIIMTPWYAELTLRPGLLSIELCLGLILYTLFCLASMSGGRFNRRIANMGHLAGAQACLAFLVIFTYATSSHGILAIATSTEISVPAVMGLLCLLVCSICKLRIVTSGR